jgi:4-hydroxy-tetrahydrodipicolinate synthase
MPGSVKSLFGHVITNRWRDGVTRLKGVIAAAATPLTADRWIDQEKLAQHCRNLLDRGCDGINLLGTTGEATSFSVAQRIETMENIARSGLPLDRFMVGTGAAALADAMRLTAKARDLAFAGALVLPPFYYKGIDAAGLAAYFDALIDAVGSNGLRLYLYHFPQNSGVPFSPEAVARLVDAHADVLLGLKDSSGDLAYSAALAQQHPTLDIFPSAEGALAKGVNAGFAGCISATLNITSSLVGQACRQQASGDPSVASTLLADATAIRNALASVPLVAAIKWALSDLQDDPLWERPMPPLRNLTDPERATLIRALAPTRYASLKPAVSEDYPHAMTSAPMTVNASRERTEVTPSPSRQ